MSKLEYYNSQRIKNWSTRTEHNNSTNDVSSPRISYHKLLNRIYSRIIPPNSSVLEFGCGNGALISAIKPGRGVGVDFCKQPLSIAKQTYPDIEFFEGDVHTFSQLNETFEYIILSDLANDLYDVQKALENIKNYCHSETKIIFNIYSNLWSAPLALARKLGMAQPVLAQNWLTPDDMRNLIGLSDMETVKSWEEILLPLTIPGFDLLFNKILVKIWPFKYLALCNMVIARLKPENTTKQHSVSIVVAARNESGNIKDILDRVPVMGSGTELIFVEGGSSDDTYSIIESAIADYHRMPVKLMKQPGKGKGDAIRMGFDAATNDILMILDADLTVMPEDLPKFYDALVSGKAEFVNGVRLVYPMEDQAMRFINLLGNKFFSLGFSYLLDQPIKDTLCGTKVLYKTNYQKIADNRDYFGEFDPFGDFDLIFGAAKLNLKILDMPVRYQSRTYGETNINRWQGGWLLLRMLVVAARKLKFV